MDDFSLEQCPPLHSRCAKSAAGALGTAAPCRAAAPASASQAAAGQCAASFPPGVREGGRIRASAFRPQRPPSPRPPALRRPHTGGFPLGRGRPRHFYITIGLCALGTRFSVVEGPTGPRLHPVPGPPVPRPGALANLLASISLITCWPRRAAETFPACRLCGRTSPYLDDGGDSRLTPRALMHLAQAAPPDRLLCRKPSS
ncbi:synapsin-1-like [Rousettus aegyptiacus]|uniref:synapsin-1-like n=1 Tax=Rousettus aegyptiacus TaxID=9407 RepID=UPI00168D964A|nr:synapsin-1-like [Rousettus aegyptiacus]